eukprot:11196744-Lingulodinium_polyedra.AAC.1
MPRSTCSSPAIWPSCAGGRSAASSGALGGRVLRRVQPGQPQCERNQASTHRRGAVRTTRFDAP